MCPRTGICATNEPADGAHQATLERAFGIVAAIYFTRAPLPGLAALALDLAALTAGLHVTGGAISPGIWASILAGPPISMGVAAALENARRVAGPVLESY